MLTAFRSNTPSFASCNKVTNLVVSSPRLFSCLLGVCGCSESPTAPSSPLLLADSSSIITRDQLRTSPLPSRPNPASESRKAIPSAAVNQPECRRECGGSRVFRASVRPGFLLISADPGDQGAGRFNERAFASQRAVGHARYDGTVQSSQGPSANSRADSKNTARDGQ